MTWYVRNYIKIIDIKQRAAHIIISGWGNLLARWGHISDIGLHNRDSQRNRGQGCHNHTEAGNQAIWTGTCCRIQTIKLMKGKALRKHSMHEKTAASVLLKPFISSNVIWLVSLHISLVCVKNRRKWPNSFVVIKWFYCNITAILSLHLTKTVSCTVNN